jgi:hypothetical protein
VCVCVCVCERERERERLLFDVVTHTHKHTDRQTDRQTHLADAYTFRCTENNF